MLRFENLLADKKLCDGRKNREIERLPSTSRLNSNVLRIILRS